MLYDTEQCYSQLTNHQSVKNSKNIQLDSSNISSETKKKYTDISN